MGDPIPSDILVKDPLTEVTRTERKTMLGVSAIAITLAKTGLIPTKITALGIDFTVQNQKALLGMVLVIVLYFAVAFVLYAACDFVAWRNAYAMLLWDRDNARRSKRGETKFPTIVMPFGIKQALSFQRALFDFVVPLVIAIYAVTNVWVAMERLSTDSRQSQTRSSAITNR